MSSEQGYPFSYECGSTVHPGLVSSSVEGNTARITFVVDYQTPGTYQLQAYVRHEACAGQNPTDAGTFDATITVTNGANLTNGPEKPTGHMDVSHDPNTGTPPGDFWVNEYGWDMDGHPYKMVFDWGDGTAPATSTQTSSSGCDDQGDWPNEGQTWVQDGGAATAHQYASPGTYTLTMTIYSEDCSGQAQQVGTVTQQLTYSG